MLTIYKNHQHKLKRLKNRMVQTISTANGSSFSMWMVITPAVGQQMITAGTHIVVPLLCNFVLLGLLYLALSLCLWLAPSHLPLGSWWALLLGMFSMTCARGR